MGKKVWAVWFSPTGTTKKIVKTIAKALSNEIGAAYGETGINLPELRATPLRFTGYDIVVFGMPVYAGRVPNVLLKFLNTLEGGGAPGIPVCVYGNRDYDDALIELRDIMVGRGFHTVAAAAFIGEHAFSYSLGKGRPDSADLTMAARFGKSAGEKIKGIADMTKAQPVFVAGTPDPYRGYYRPKDANGEAIEIRKVKPLTKETCNGCKTCAGICLMGAISQKGVRTVDGVCIKCGACVKHCPMQAKYFADEGYLFHKKDLEARYARRAQPEVFL